MCSRSVKPSAPFSMRAAPACVSTMPHCKQPPSTRRAISAPNSPVSFTQARLPQSISNYEDTTVLNRWISHDLLALIARVSMGAIFFLSARTKVDGVLHVTDSTIFLFTEEYKLPLLPP